MFGRFIVFGLVFGVASRAWAADVGRCGIEGRVIDSRGRVLAGVSVFAQLEGDSSSLAARTNGSGEFRFTNLDSGNWTLDWRKPGYYATELFRPVLSGRQLPTLQIEPGKTTKVTLTLTPNSILRGIVRDPNGKLLRNTFVRILGVHAQPGDAFGGDSGFEVKADSRGRFEKSFSGNYFLGSLSCFAPGVGWAEPKTIQLERDRPVQVDYQLHRGGVVDGVVVASDGITPVADARVTIRHERPWFNSSSPVYQANDGSWAWKQAGYRVNGAAGESLGQVVGGSEVDTDSRGRFRFDIVPPGRISVTASTGRWRTKPVRLVLDADVHNRSLRLVLSEREAASNKPSALGR